MEEMIELFKDAMLHLDGKALKDAEVALSATKKYYADEISAFQYGKFFDALFVSDSEDIEGAETTARKALCHLGYAVPHLKRGITASNLALAHAKLELSRI